MSARTEALARAFATPVDGPTYRMPTRIAAGALVAALLVTGARVLLTSPEPLDMQRATAAAVVALALLWPMPSILFGRTVVDARGVRQLGWMGKEAEWSTVQSVRFLRMPLAPRLLVRAGFGRVKVFHSGSAALDDAFERAVRLLSGPLGPTS